MQETTGEYAINDPQSPDYVKDEDDPIYITSQFWVYDDCKPYFKFDVDMDFEKMAHGFSTLSPFLEIKYGYKSNFAFAKSKLGLIESSNHLTNPLLDWGTKWENHVLHSYQKVLKRLSKIPKKQKDVNPITLAAFGQEYPKTEGVKIMNGQCIHQKSKAKRSRPRKIYHQKTYNNKKFTNHRRIQQPKARFSLQLRK
jgi:hypothetical protein